MQQQATAGAAASTTLVEDHHAAAAATVAPRKRQRVPIAFTHDYDELHRLGAGAFGVVTKARHRATNEVIAIKRHRRSTHSHNGDLLRESHFLTTCGDLPFLVGYRGLARDLATSDLCLLMEYVGPTTLHSYLHTHPHHLHPLPEHTVRAAMWQLLTGVRMMHERHVVHRDIKPGNILVGEDRRTVKICDLGLAIDTSSEPPPYARAGTLGYMAPEVLLGKVDYDARVDTWSLGCVMAELVRGRALFVSRDEVEQLWKIYEVLDVSSENNNGHRRHDEGLREVFPEEMLTKDGFEVLSGLLAFEAAERLTADAALKLPWFDNVGALALPKEEVVVAAPRTVHKKRRRIGIQSPLPKKPKVF